MHSRNPSVSVVVKIINQKKLQTQIVALIPIRLYLQGAASLQHCLYSGALDLCYEFFTQAFVIYEEEISDSKELVYFVLRFVF